jgi:hypothetical protein
VAKFSLRAKRKIFLTKKSETIVKKKQFKAEIDLAINGLKRLEKRKASCHDVCET